MLDGVKVAVRDVVDVGVGLAPPGPNETVAVLVAEPVRVGLLVGSEPLDGDTEGEGDSLKAVGVTDTDTEGEMDELLDGVALKMLVLVGVGAMVAGGCTGCAEGYVTLGSGRKKEAKVPLRHEQLKER